MELRLEVDGLGWKHTGRCDPCQTARCPFRPPPPTEDKRRGPGLGRPASSGVLPAGRDVLLISPQKTCLKHVFVTRFGPFVKGPGEDSSARCYRVRITAVLAMATSSFGCQSDSKIPKLYLSP